MFSKQLFLVCNATSIWHSHYYVQGYGHITGRTHKEFHIPSASLPYMEGHTYTHDLLPVGVRSCWMVLCNLLLRVAKTWTPSALVSISATTRVKPPASLIVLERTLGRWAPCCRLSPARVRQLWRHGPVSSCQIHFLDATLTSTNFLFRWPPSVNSCVQQFIVVDQIEPYECLHSFANNYRILNV